MLGFGLGATDLVHTSHWIEELTKVQRGTVSAFYSRSG